jgi:hypothetical protein
MAEMHRRFGGNRCIAERHGVTSEMKVLFVVTVVEYSDPTCYCWSAANAELAADTYGKQSTLKVD